MPLFFFCSFTEERPNKVERMLFSAFGGRSALAGEAGSLASYLRLAGGGNWWRRAGAGAGGSGQSRSFQGSFQVNLEEDVDHKFFSHLNYHFLFFRFFFSLVLIAVPPSLSFMAK